MAFLQTSKTRAARYDVVVVGSGAAGGMAALTLAKAGAKVLMLEAGRNYDPRTETPMFQSNADAPLRGANTPDKPYGFFDATIGGWVVKGEPYTVKNKTTDQWQDGTFAKRDATDQNFMWWRSRMLGGRTNHWGRVSLRMGPDDFKPRSTDGLGFDWPISYEEVAPFYDRTDQIVGIFGSKEGLRNDPDSDFFLPAPKPRAYELLFQRGSKKLGIPVIPSRHAVLTKPMPGRAPCFYATPCSRGCAIGAAFQSTTSLIPYALETGNLDILTNAHAREVTLDAQGRANGVHFFDKESGKEEHVSARAVVLGASACESARILFNSRSERFPQGLGNSTGHLGRWLTDSTAGDMSGQIPALENMPLHNEDGVSFGHTYAPWSEVQAKSAKTAGSPRGYYTSFGGGRRMPGGSASLGPNGGSLFGTKLKEEARRYFGSFVSASGRGEMVPNEHCRAELDPVKKDRFGIPVLRFHWKWNDYEVRQVEHMQRTFAEMIEAAGGKVSKQPIKDATSVMTAGGSVNHEMGVARMSATPKEGVTNPFSGVWDCPNVVVADAGVFVSSPYKNPTLTIMALAMRACEHLLAGVKDGSIAAPAA
jgi:choline dehydrogenase-like flavoprotein